MAEIIDWLNLAMAADTNKAVHAVAQAQVVLAQAELHRRADHSLVNEIVDLYAKARDLRQRGQLLGAFTLTVTAKEKYFLGLPGLRDAELKMRLVEVDEKLNRELTLLMEPEQLACIVMELGAFMNQTLNRSGSQIQDISTKLEEARTLSLNAGRQSNLNVVRAEILSAWKSHAILARFFDPGLVGPLGPLESRWRSAVADIENKSTSGMNAWLKKLKELIAQLDAETKKASDERIRSEGKIAMVVVIVVAVGIALLSIWRHSN